MKIAWSIYRKSATESTLMYLTETKEKSDCLTIAIGRIHRSCCEAKDSDLTLRNYIS